MKLARYSRRWMLATSDIPSASAKAVQKWRLTSLIAKFCAALANSHGFKFYEVYVWAE
jgi:hypothetical protein